MRTCGTCGSAAVDTVWACAECGARPTTISGFTAFAPDLAVQNEGFREEYFAQLAALEATNFWFRARNDLIIWAMRRYFPDVSRYLEVGCGNGFVMSGVRAAFRDAELSGSEIFSAGLAFAAARVPSATFYQMDARQIPFRDHFDVVGAFDVIEHIAEDEAVLAEVARAVRPGGGLLLTVPQHPALWSAQDAHAFHIRRYTAAGLRRTVEAAGFQIVRMTSFVSLLLPMMFVSRARMREPGADTEIDAMGDLRQPRVVNLALGGVMTIERTLIRGGVSFPAGGSLLVVARKRVAGSAA